LPPGNGNGGSSGGGGGGGGGGEDIPIIKLESKVNTDGSYKVSGLYMRNQIMLEILLNKLKVIQFQAHFKSKLSQ